MTGILNVPLTLTFYIDNIYRWCHRTDQCPEADTLAFDLDDIELDTEVTFEAIRLDFDELGTQVCCEFCMRYVSTVFDSRSKLEPVPDAPHDFVIVLDAVDTFDERIVAYFITGGSYDGLVSAKTRRGPNRVVTTADETTAEWVYQLVSDHVLNAEEVTIERVGSDVSDDTVTIVRGSTNGPLAHPGEAARAATLLR